MMNNYDMIRPYTDEELPVAMERITGNRLFPIFVHYYLNMDTDSLRSACRSVHTVDEFQLQVMRPLLKNLMKQTTTGFSTSGIEQLDGEQPYLFISNHRDIVLDAAWLDVALIDADKLSMEITFGSNLMTDQFSIDLGKINKMFRMMRGGGTRREFYASMMEVSKYMRYVLTDKNLSVWIAQRNGRTKDGNDQTEVALLKMLAMSSKDDFVENMGALNICPVSVSYEYEPCDFMKTAEVYKSRRRNYVKQKGEDARSIQHGLTQFKGKVHFEVLSPITKADLKECVTRTSRSSYNTLARLIDKKIYQGYKMHKTNYIAYDMLFEGHLYGVYYTEEEQHQFEKYMLDGLHKLAIEGDEAELRDIFLHIYAMPLINLMTVDL